MLIVYSMRENHMSKNYFKTEEAPPLKKSIINKVEKQYGKDNPKTYATLWKIYKDKKKNEDAPANATGSSVSGTGDDISGAGKKKKKKKSPWDKYAPDALGKQFGGTASRKYYMESTVAEPNVTPDDTFAGVDVFNVNDSDFNNCKFGKKKHARWDKYVDVESETGKRITDYAKKNPKKSIIVQHDKTGHMLYLKKYDMGGEQ